MSQRVVGIAVLMLGLAAADVYAACPGAGKLTITIAGDPNSAIARSPVTMTETSAETGLATAALVDQQSDPYINGLALFFAKSDQCGALFPNDGGINLGTTKKDTSGNAYHIVPGLYCDASNRGDDPKAPLTPRNVMNIAGTTGNQCGHMAGSFEVTALDLVWDSNNLPHVNRAEISFTAACGDTTPDGTKLLGPAPVNGTIKYVAFPANQGTPKPTGKFNVVAGSAPPCTSTPGGGSGGSGSGGGSTTTPTNVAFSLPDDVSAGPVVMNADQTVSFDVSTAVLPGFSSDLQLAVLSDANDREVFDVSISPNMIAAPGAGTAKVTVTTHPLTFPRDYVVTLLATSMSDQAVSARSFTVSVLCDPPKILGTKQPVGQTITGSNNATLTVTSAGSPPFTYQWYTGMRGMTNFPVTNATSDTLKTNQDGMYWVRVSNACGSVDSEPATVTH